MHKIVGSALDTGAALAAIAPAHADPALAACLELDRLRETANTLHKLADSFEAATSMMTVSGRPDFS